MAVVRNKRKVHREISKKKIKKKKSVLRKNEDEDISSDTASIASLEHESQNNTFSFSNKKKSESKSPSVSEDEQDLQNSETIAEQKVKLAKYYLEQIGWGAKTDKEIEEQLTQEAIRAANEKRQTTFFDHVSILESSKFYKGHKNCVTSVALAHADKSRAFTASKDCSIIAWDLETGSKTTFSGRRNEVLKNGGHFSHCLDIQCCPFGRIVFSAGKDRFIRVWDVRASTEKCAIELLGHTNSITALCLEAIPSPSSFSLNQTVLYSVSEDKSLKQWELVFQTCTETFYGHIATPNCIDILTKKHPITGGSDNTVRLWNIKTGTHFLYERHTQPIDAVVQLDPYWFLSGSQDGSIGLWSVGRRKPLTILTKLHNDHWITALGCVRYSNVFFSGSDDGYIRCWKIQSKKNPLIEPVVNCSIPIEGVINKIVISHDGEFGVAAVSREHRLGRWTHIKEATNGLYVFRCQLSE